MKEEIKQLYPRWVNDKKNEYKLLITDDIDSLFSAAIIRKYIKAEVGFFYDFKTLHKRKNLSNANSENIIAVDCALEGSYKCFDNHVTLLTEYDAPNPNSANINNLLKVNRENYFEKKFAMGTHLQVLSYYDAIDFSKLSQDQKMILWAIDGSYKGHFSYENDRKAHIKYIDLLELEQIADVLEKYKESDFHELINEYGLNKKIASDRYGFLDSDIQLDKLQGLFPQFDLLLPEQPFKASKELAFRVATLEKSKSYSKEQVKAFSFALIGKHKAVFSQMLPSKGSDSPRKEVEKLDEYIDYITVVSSDDGHRVYGTYADGLVFLHKFTSYIQAEQFAEDMAGYNELSVIYTMEQ